MYFVCVWVLFVCIDDASVQCYMDVEVKVDTRQLYQSLSTQLFETRAFTIQDLTNLSSKAPETFLSPLCQCQNSRQVPLCPDFFPLMLGIELGALCLNSKQKHLPSSLSVYICNEWGLWLSPSTTQVICSVTKLSTYYVLNLADANIH